MRDFKPVGVVERDDPSLDAGADDADAGVGLDHEELDRQHTQLTEGFRRFAELAHSSQRRAEAADCLRELVTLVGAHFGFEESLMMKSGFPEFDHHLRQHLGMMTELGLLLDKLKEGTDPNIVRQAEFVTDWYQRHVDLSDRKFVSWLAR